MKSAAARAHPNIAFIKYWGNKDDALRLPQNPSLSMNLAGLFTDTQVSWDDSISSDILSINGQIADHTSTKRVNEHLTAIRDRLQINAFARVESRNNFPIGAGIASSASAFAALSLAAVVAAGYDMSERELSTFARLGSGSASRSVPAGFVEWHEGEDHRTSYAETIAPPEYWNLVDLVAVVSDKHKSVTSKHGHTTASTSDLQVARVAKSASRLKTCKQAILDRDFTTFADVVEIDSNLMHAVMMTSKPPLFYWQPTSLTIMQKVREWREDGLNVCYTLDAGPNVHCLCLMDSVDEVHRGLQEINGVQEIFVAPAGEGAHVIQSL